MSVKSIKEVAEIIPGYVFRGAIEDNSLGNTAVIQASHIDGRALMADPESFKRIVNAPERSRAFLEPGDVLIAARGSATGGFKSVVFPRYEKPVIASSSVYIIRLKPEAGISPEFLSTYLNSDNGQVDIMKKVVGGVTRAVRGKDIEDLELSIPTIVEQETLVGFRKNIQEQERLLRERIVLTSRIFEGALQTVVR